MGINFVRGGVLVTAAVNETGMDFAFSLTTRVVFIMAYFVTSDTK